MIPAGSLRLVDEAEPSPELQETREDPKVFVRTLMAPPGLPWEQGRTADLDARLGAPLPAGDVVYQLKRLASWRPGAAARFAAFYVLAKDVDGRLETHAQVDGKDVRVVFESADQAALRAKRLGVIGLVAGALAFLVVVAVGLALNRRAELEASLETAEQKAVVKLKGVSGKARLKAQEQALRAWPDKGAPVSDVLADLAWISGAKSGSAEIEGLHWDHGYLAIEARSAKPPIVVFGDQKLERSIRPIRPGTWLWGAKRTPVQASVEAPVVALPRTAVRSDR
jgi:hypothetical protein